MKRNIIFLLIVVLSFVGCEKDDICIDNTTPNLIIRFYNISATDSIKKVDSLTVLNLDNNAPITNNTITASTDSIAIPLSVLNDKTTYVLTANNNNDTITIVYTRIDDFVSRSCGYKTLYNNVVVSVKTDNNNWIQQIGTVNLPQNIENEKEAHIKIWH